MKIPALGLESFFFLGIRLRIADLAVLRSPKCQWREVLLSKLLRYLFFVSSGHGIILKSIAYLRSTECVLYTNLC